MTQKKNTKSHNKNLWSGTAAGALLATFLVGAMGKADAAESASVVNTPFFSEQFTGELEASAKKSENLPQKQDNRRLLAATALSGFAASLFGLFGANRLLQFIAAFGQALGQWTSKAGESAVNSAKTAAKATAAIGKKIMARPTRFLMIAGGLTLFAFTGIAIFDVEWQAGLLAGAGATGAAIYGFRKTGEAFKNVIKRTPFGKASPLMASAS